MRRIAIVTGTRADWGLLSPIARELQRRPDTALYIIATNMHLDPRYGNTIDEITGDGFTIDERVAMEGVTGDDGAGKVAAMAACMSGMAGAFKRLCPDAVVILGDRYEMLATASAALMMRIPIIHIAGGAISEGAVDDSIRHAITKMAWLHLVETEEYRRRVIQMGEQPGLVVNTGAIGVYNIMHQRLMSREELSRSIGHDITPDTLLVTYHAATLDKGDTDARARELFRALDRFPDNPLLITYPNNDAGGRVIIDHIERYAALHPGRVTVVPSLGMRRYLSALRCVAAVVGNSSSGIVEVPSMGIPTVDIGMRQQGRMASASVIHTTDDAPSIAAGIARALSPQGRETAATTVNPYYRPDTLRLMVDAITSTPLSTQKKFHNL